MRERGWPQIAQIAQIRTDLNFTNLRHLRNLRPKLMTMEACRPFERR